MTANYPTHERCQYRTPTGRQCTSGVLDPESSYCDRHAAYEPKDSEDFEAALTRHAGEFNTPEGMNFSLGALYKLLAAGRISLRRASTLAYISSLLMRNMYNILPQDLEPPISEIDPALLSQLVQQPAPISPHNTALSGTASTPGAAPPHPSST